MLEETLGYACDPDFKKKRFRKKLKKILLSSFIGATITLSSLVCYNTYKNNNISSASFQQYLQARNEKPLWDVNQSPGSVNIELSYKDTWDYFETSIENGKLIINRTTIRGPYYFFMHPIFAPTSTKKYTFP